VTELNNQLARIEKQMRAMEEKYQQTQKFHQQDLDILENLVQPLSNHRDPFFQKISLMIHHFSTEMELRHFLNYLVPVERALKRSLKDQDLGIQTQDLAQRRKDPFPLILVLDHLRSAFNVGSILRTSEFLGVQEVWCVGYTADSQDPGVQKSSMGTHELVPIKNFSSMQEALLALKKLHFRIIGFETSSQSESLYQKFQVGPTAFLFGNERFGLEPDILKECDEIRVIPGYGRKNSLNVAVSVGIACSEWVRQCL
jgi:23S rRNA (guanosine2251-2'-O)-methyltransferase